MGAAFTPEKRKELRKFFDVSMDYFQLSPESRKVAWESANRSEIRAYHCYRQIVNSLPRPDMTEPVAWIVHYGTDRDVFLDRRHADTMYDERVREGHVSHLRALAEIEDDRNRSNEYVL